MEDKQIQTQVPESFSFSYRLLSRFRRPAVGIFRLIPKCFAEKLMDLFRYSNSCIGFAIRYLCINRLASKCGKKVIIFPSVFIKEPKFLEIGTNVSIHEFTYIDAEGGLEIGDHVGIGHGCTILCGQHNFNVPDKLMKESGYTFMPVKIENDVWLGAHVRVLPGITLCQGCVIGASSVVTKTIPKYSVAVGIPARVIRNRFETKEPEMQNSEKTGYLQRKEN